MDVRPEILAPAGGMEHLTAAVRSGANAVYLGTQNFNARRNAQNFDAQSLPAAVSYCHARGVKVYAALNTLVFDKELAPLADEICMLADCAVDALIVQDLGAAALARKICPALPLHASTQMTIHNASGAKQLEALGFSRVVLARELTEKEIGQIAAETNIELEVFVHGALCMSVSGQCYISSMLGGRSGNRGLCAQPCRLDFNSQGRSFALSLKDLSLIPRMGSLQSLRIAALKIEGRMKRPEYVAAAVQACKQALDEAPADMETLRAVFSRSGFTQGYFEGKRDLAMFGSRTKEDVLAAGQVLRQIASGYRNETPLSPVSMRLTLQKGKSAVLSASAGEYSVKISGPVPQQAQKQPLTKELAERSLSKTGGTPFYLNSLQAALDEGLTLPVSALNQLRKEALEKLLEARGELSPHHCHPIDLSLPKIQRTTKKPELRLRFSSPSQMSEASVRQADKVILPVEYITAPMIERHGDKLIGELPLLIFPANEKKLHEKLSELKDKGLHAAAAGNLGAIHLTKALGFVIHADYSMNILNSRALLALAQMGVKDATLSFETGLRQARELSSGIPAGLLAYGHLPLMVYRNCPAKTSKGCGGCNGRAELTDRIQKSFPVVCRGREYSQLLNTLPLYLADKAQDLMLFDFITLYFTIENAAECEELLRRYREHLPPEGEFTRGLYYRAIE